MANITQPTVQEAFSALELTLGASLADVKASYKFLLHSFHEDKFPPGPLKDKARERTSAINVAYGIVTEAFAGTGGSLFALRGLTDGHRQTLRKAEVRFFSWDAGGILIDNRLHLVATLALLKAHAYEQSGKVDGITDLRLEFGKERGQYFQFSQAPAESSRAGSGAGPATGAACGAGQESANMATVVPLSLYFVGQDEGKPTEQQLAVLRANSIQTWTTGSGWTLALVVATTDLQKVCRLLNLREQNRYRVEGPIEFVVALSR